MDGDERATFEDLDLVGQDMDVEHAPARRLGDAVEVAPDADQALVRKAPFELEDGPVGRHGQGRRNGFSSAKASLTTRSVVAWTRGWPRCRASAGAAR